MVIYNVNDRYLYLLDSLASDLVRKYVKEYFADTIFKTKMFEEMYNQFVEGDAILNEIYLVNLVKPQQVKNLCAAYLAHYVYMLIEKDMSVGEIYTDPNCNDDYIENVWMEKLGEIVNRL